MSATIQRKREVLDIDRDQPRMRHIAVPPFEVGLCGYRLPVDPNYDALMDRDAPRTADCHVCVEIARNRGLYW